METLLSGPAGVSFNIVKRSIACALLLASVSGCKSRDPYVVLTVEDESGIANNAVVLAIGSDPKALSQRGILGRKFPITVTLTSEGEAEKPLWVEAWDVNDRVVARGYEQVPFDDDRELTVVVRLGLPCEDVMDCRRPFCDGEPTCDNRICSAKFNPCGGPVDPEAPCVQLSCDPDQERCLATPNHALCAPIATSSTTEDATYCHPQEGCVRGAGCKDGPGERDADGVHLACQDGFKCNGVEDCRDYRCIAGPSIVEDNNPCTIDACDETSGAVHFEDIRARGTRCTTEDGTEGVCNGVACLTSDCGDGVVDTSTDSTEACDDGNFNHNDGCFECSLTSWTPVLVTGAGLGGTTPSEIALGIDSYLAIDRSGILYVGDGERNVVYAIDTETNAAAIIAGTGALPDFDANVTAGIPATELGFSYIGSIAVDSTGQLYIADDHAYVFRVDDRTGLAEPHTGDGLSPGSSSVLGEARSTAIGIANEVFVDGRGNLYVAGLTDDGWVLRVDALTQRVSLVAGSYDGDPANSNGDVLDPQGLAVDDDGNVYIADYLASAVLRVDAFTGQVTTLIGDDAVDAGLRRALIGPIDVALDSEGYLYVADQGEDDTSVIYRADLEAGTISEYVAASEGLIYVTSLAVDAESNLYIADEGRVQRKKRGGGLIEPVIGAGQATRALTVRSDSTPLDLVQDVVIGPGGYPHFIVKNTIQRLDAENRTLTTVVTVEDDVIYLIAAARNGDLYYTTGEALFALDGLTPPRRVLELADSFSQTAMAVEANGDLLFLETYFDEFDEECTGVRRYAVPGGEITPVAGCVLVDSGDPNGDGGPALDAAFVSPLGLAVDLAGNIYVGDSFDDRVRKIDAATDTIDTFAFITVPNDIELAANGDVLIAADREVARISPDGTRRTALLDNRGDQTTTGDGELALNAGGSWYAAVEDAGGEIFVATGERVRKIDTAGMIITVAGQVEPFGNGLLPSTKLAAPVSIARGVDPEGGEVFFVADGASGRIRAVDQGRGVQSTAVGYPGGSTAEGASATYARTLAEPHGIAFDEPLRKLYVTETGAAKISALDISTRPYKLSTWVSTGLLAPEGMAIDQNALYVADSGTHVIKKFDLRTDPPTAVVVAGRENNLGYFGDGGPADQALLSSPRAVAVAAGRSTIYIADYGNRRVRRVDANGLITTVIGDGSTGSGGSGSPADRLPCDEPLGLAVDPEGNLFVASKNTLRIVVAGRNGIADGSDEVLLIYGIPPRERFPEPLTSCLAGLVIAGDGRLMQLDRCRGFMIELTREKLPFVRGME